MTANQIQPRVLMVVGNIPGLNTGRGGHYYSVKEIATELNRHFPVEVLVLGGQIPDTLKDLPGVKWIACRQTPSFSVIKHIRERIAQFAPDVIHCMDSASLLFMRIADLSAQVPICWTKCGGRPTTRYVPRKAPDIVFHQEDQDYFRKRGLFPLLIPNRFRIPATTGKRTAEYGTGPLRIVRISRICEKYSAGLHATIDLHRALLERNPDATLDIIGFPEDQSVLAILKVRAAHSVRFLTDDDVTKEASRHLPNYHLAVASGRAAMEALSYGLPTFTTPTNSPAPVLACAQTIDAMLTANFSERACISSSLAEAVASVEALVSEPRALIAYREWSEGVYRANISIESAVERYRDFYRGLIRQGYRESRSDVAKHALIFRGSMLLRTSRDAIRRTRP